MCEAQHARWFDGELGELRVYDREFTPREVYYDYTIPLAPFILRPRVYVKASAAGGIGAEEFMVAANELAATGGMIGRTYV